MGLEGVTLRGCTVLRMIALRRCSPGLVTYMGTCSTGERFLHKARCAYCEKTAQFVVVKRFTVVRTWGVLQPMYNKCMFAALSRMSAQRVGIEHAGLAT